MKRSDDRSPLFGYLVRREPRGVVSTQTGEAYAWAAEGAPWWLTITGPPGSGKTRLAAVASATLGVDANALWVDLQDGGDPFVRVAEAAGLAATDPAALVRAFRERVDFLVLDGCERLATASLVELERLLAKTVGLRVLATSRTRLAVDGERILALDRFGAPTAGTPWASSLSGHLLLDRVATLDPSHRFAAVDDEAVGTLLEIVGDLPLAIELLAAPLVELGASALVARRDRPLSWLVSADHRVSLDRLLEEAVAQTSPDALRLAASLATLDRPFSLDDAESIATGLGLAPADVAAWVQELRRRSWSRPAGPGLTDFQPAIRAFLSSLATTDTEAARAVDRAEIVAAARGRDVTPERLLRAVRRSGGEDAASIVTALETAFSRFATAGLLHELGAVARDVADRHPRPVVALRLAARAFTEVGAFDRAEEAIARFDGGPDAERAVLARARIAFRTGRYDELAALSHPLRPDSADEAEVIATAASMQGDAEGAAWVFEQSLLRARASDRPIILAMRARFLAESGAPSDALVAVEEVEGESSDARVRASAEATRAMAWHDLSRWEDALAAYDRAIATYDAMGNVLATTLRYARGVATLQAERFAEARATFRAALRDTPDALVHLRPLRMLGRFAVHAEPPRLDALPAVAVVASSTRLVHAYARRCLGDASLVAPSVLSNEEFARWSVVSRALARLAFDGPVLDPVARTPPRVLLVDRECRWFATPEAPACSLASRPVLQRVLSALVRARESGVEWSSLDAIAAAAWPGEQILERARKSRVHVAISTLRGLGLREHLETAPSGYRLTLAVRRADDRS